MRRPYMFLNRRARRLERKIGRTVVAGTAGGVAGATAATATKKTDNTKSAGSGHSRPNNTSSSHSGGNGKPPALPDKMSQKKDSSKSEVHSSSASQTQEMQSTSKRGIVDKKSVSKQPQSEKQNPQRPIVDKSQDKQETQKQERQGNGSATKGTAPLHERPVTTPVTVKSNTQAASRQEKNVKERPVTGDKEPPQLSKTKEPVTKSQENVRTQVVRESNPIGKQVSSSDTTRQTVQRQKQTKTVQKKNTTGSSVRKSTSKKGGKK